MIKAKTEHRDAQREKNENHRGFLRESPLSLRLSVFQISGLLLVAFFFLLIPTVSAQTAVTDNDVNEIAKGLYCPVCESTPLDVCPTQACADWRELIREQLASGMSKADIEAYFATQYGDGVLAEPPRSGINLLLWFSPILALLVGGVIFYRAMRQYTNTPIAQSPNLQSPIPNQPTKQSLQSYRTRIEAELSELNQST